MFEKSCAFLADSFVRVDSSELATTEPLGGEDENPQPIGDHDRTGLALPATAAEAGDFPAVATAEPTAIARESDDLAIVARSRGGIKRRRYELRFSYYLSFCFRFGFLLRFLQGLLGNAGRDQDRGTPGQPDITLEPDKTGNVWRRS
jgi:hypothetical protein